MNPLLLALLTGCTLQPGTGFATLTGVDLTLALEPGDARDLGDQTILTDAGYQVQIDSMVLTVDRLALVELLGGSTSFDPANPPEGYSLCHGGHCHHDDGRLVDYAEIEAELAGDSATFDDVVSLDVGRDSELWDANTWALDVPAELAELPATTLRRVSVHGDWLSLNGTAISGALGDERVDVTASLALSTSFDGPYDQVIDREAPATFVLAVDLIIDGTLFDGLDLATLAVDGHVSLDANETFLSTLGNYPPTATLLEKQ
jgi:hypothetical protein